MATEAEESRCVWGLETRERYIKGEDAVDGSCVDTIILFVLFWQCSGVDWGHSHASCSGSPTVEKDTD